MEAPENLHDVSWMTQFRISDTKDLTINGLIPDLVAEADSKEGAYLLIIECKVSAEFTYQTSAEGRERSQLASYERYLRSRTNAGGEVILLTHLTSRPEDWHGKVVRWSELCEALNLWINSDELSGFPVVERYASEFVEFLEENDMGEIKLDVTEIASFRLWNQLESACKNLGAFWKDIEGSALQNHLERGGFSLPHGRAFGDFISPAFFGDTVLTAGDKKTRRGVGVGEAYVVCWIGVLLKTIFDVIRPVVEGIPEFHSGFALWLHSDHLADEVIKKRLDMIAKTLGEDWRMTVRNDQNYPDDRVLWIVKRESFLTLVGEETNWNAKAKEFLGQVAMDLQKLSSDDLKFLSSWQQKTAKVQ